MFNQTNKTVFISFLIDLACFCTLVKNYDSRDALNILYFVSQQWNIIWNMLTDGAVYIGNHINSLYLFKSRRKNHKLVRFGIWSKVIKRWGMVRTHEILSLLKYLINWWHFCMEGFQRDYQSSERIKTLVNFNRDYIRLFGKNCIFRSPQVHDLGITRKWMVYTKKNVADCWKFWLCRYDVDSFLCHRFLSTGEAVSILCNDLNQCWLFWDMIAKKEILF